MMTRSAVGLALVLSLSATSQAVLQYTAPGGSFSATSVDPNASGSVLNTSGSTAVLEPGISIADVVFLRSTISTANAADAVSNAQFFQFTFSANAGFQADLSSLTFDATKGGSSGPRGWVLRSSLDAFGSNIDTDSITSELLPMTPFSVDLSAPQFQDVSTVTFRIYGYAPASTGIYFDNITLNGSVTPVPEPATMASLGAGLIVLVRRRRSLKR